MPRYYYPITPILKFKKPEGRGSCYQQFASPGPHGDGLNRFVVIFDEDIDFRVFERLDAIYKLAAPDLPDILAIGERKGHLTVVLRKPFALFDYADTESKLQALSTDGDYWPLAAFTEEKFSAFRGLICHPAISQESFMEAVTWKA